MNLIKRDFHTTQLLSLVCASQAPQLKHGVSKLPASFTKERKAKANNAKGIELNPGLKQQGKKHKHTRPSMFLFLESVRAMVEIFKFITILGGEMLLALRFLRRTRFHFHLLHKTATHLKERGFREGLIVSFY